MGSSEKFCLKWNDFETNISGAFRELREDKDFFDVTLACDDDQLQAHKVILSACSPFFRTILRRNKHEHPLLYLKGVKYADLVSVLNFMYHGEVNVAQEELNSFLAVAEDLRVKGLTQTTSDTRAAANSQPSGSTKQKIHNVVQKSEPSPQQKHPQLKPPTLVRRTPTHTNYQPQDDDIQEVVPVKSEPITHPPDTQTQSITPMSHTMPAYTTPQVDQVVSGGVVADPNMDYGEEEYGDYEEYGGAADGSYGAADGGYGAAEGSYIAGGMVVGQDGNKDLDVLISESMSRTVEEGVALWKCHLCERSSKDKSIMRHHIETHFPGQNVCQYCGQASKTRKSLRMHIANHHGPRNIQ